MRLLPSLKPCPVATASNSPARDGTSMTTFTTFDWITAAIFVLLQVVVLVNQPGAALPARDRREARPRRRRCARDQDPGGPASSSSMPPCPACIDRIEGRLERIERRLELVDEVTSLGH